MEKRVGNFLIRTYRDSDAVYIEHWKNEHVKDALNFTKDEIRDLLYAIECAERHAGDS